VASRIKILGRGGLGPIRKSSHREKPKKGDVVRTESSFDDGSNCLNSVKEGRSAGKKKKKRKEKGKGRGEMRGGKSPSSASVENVFTKNHGEKAIESGGGGMCKESRAAGGGKTVTVEGGKGDHDSPFQQNSEPIATTQTTRWI